MAEAVASRWYNVFTEALRHHELAPQLRQAAIEERLTPWTRALTEVVLSTFTGMAWTGAAKGHRWRGLPVRRQEYLSLDAMAFAAAVEQEWQFPVAVFELENSRRDDAVAYSLWKVLAIRNALRVVLCYRAEPAQGSALIRSLAGGVVKALGLGARSSLAGECLVVVGSRSEREVFPYGFFKPWLLDAPNGRFTRA